MPVDRTHLIPLSIAATGHRDIPPASVAPLEAQVQRVLEELKAAAPHTPLEVFSALAEGADRLVARVALRVGARLIVPLPMELEQYVEDFPDPASRHELQQLLDRADRTFVVPAPPDDDGDRSNAYARLGAYLARHSHVLIAVWNGLDPQKLGGTADVVRFKLEGVPATYQQSEYLLLSSETGPVYHVVTPRLSNPSITEPPHTIVLRYPKSHVAEESAQQMWKNLVDKTDGFNRDAAEQSEKTKRQRASSRQELLKYVDETFLDPAMRATLDLFEYADALAIGFQMRTSIFLRSIFFIVFAAAVAFEIYAHHVWEEIAMIAIYVALLVVAYFINRREKKSRDQDKHLDYRALAEGLRVQYYWQLAGVHPTAADHYLRHQRHELDWIRAAIRGRSAEVYPGISLASRLERLTVALQAWVQGQYAYFNKTLGRYKAQRHTVERRVHVLIGAGIAAAMILIFTKPWLKQQGLHGYAVLTIGVLLVAAGLLHAYLDKRALSSHIKRYSRTLQLYDDAKRQIEEALARNDEKRACKLFRELGREALDENSDWVVVVRDRPLEVPVH